MKSDCSCWQHYPNQMKKRENGKWICVDKYKCIRDRIDGKHYGAKTLCIRKDKENG